MDEIAVGAVQLGDSETGVAGAGGGGGEALHDAGDVLCGEGVRVGGAGDEGDGAGGERNPAAIGRRDRRAAVPGALAGRLAAGMGDLDAGNGPAARDDLGEAGKECLMLIVPQAEAMRGDAAGGGDMGRLGEDDARTAGGAGAEMLDVPIAAEPIFGAVLAHRRDDDAVARGDRAEGDGFEELRRVRHGR